jgi:hypothetical protein
LISLLVLLETEWVLRSRYGLQKSQIMDAVSGLLDAAELSSKTSPRSRKRFTSGRTALPILQIA